MFSFESRAYINFITSYTDVLELSVTGDTCCGTGLLRPSPVGSTFTVTQWCVALDDICDPSHGTAEIEPRRNFENL
jgi:hypothetical protein